MILEQHDAIALQADRLDGRSRWVGGNRGSIAGAKCHGEGCTLSDARAPHVDVAAVQAHQVMDDRQTEAETAETARGRTVRLTEPVEHVRKESRIDSNSRVSDFDSNVLVTLLRGD